LSYHHAQDQIPSVSDALNSINVPAVKQLAALVSTGPLPTRKAELIALVSARLEREDVLRQVWGRLDDTQRAAVAEVVHGPSAYLLPDQFRAKYGRTPEFGALDYSYYGRSGAPIALRLFFFGGLTMPDDLRARLRALVPRPRAVTIRAD
jgi:hypothetical protein